MYYMGFARSWVGIRFGEGGVGAISRARSRQAGEESRERDDGDGELTYELNCS